MKEAHIKWPATIAGAGKLQERDRNRVMIAAFDKDPEFVAGVDASFSEKSVFAAACLYRYPAMTLVEQSAESEKRIFPYVPGDLLFLEGRAVMAALNKLKKRPDIVLVDGHGIAHPRGIGSASHLGVLLDIPAIGCAKTRLVGEFTEPDNRKGNWSELRFGKKVIGAVLRTRDGVRPLFVSPGHKIDLENSIRIVLGCVEKYRVPEPLRCADMLSKRSREGKPLSLPGA
jgi:deoxyribonuclease V